MGIISNFIQTKSLFLESISNNCWTNIVFTLRITLLYNITCYPHFLCYFFHLYKIFFFTFCVFLYIIIYTLIIARAIKKDKCQRNQRLYL